MASYKVIQNVEAEDKLIGSLTMKQFFYALIATAIIFAGWFLSKRTSYYALIPFIIGSLPFVFLAIPLGRDQPNDVWLLARLNFMLRPRKRLWSQASNPQKPIIIEKDSKEIKASLTDGRTAQEIRDQVRSLGNILDSRGRYLESEASSVKTPMVIHHEKKIDEEHEKKHSSLNQRFHKLLNHHKENHKKNIGQRIRQTLRAQSHNLYQTPKDIKDQSLKTPTPKHLSAKISEITKSKDLKISTLESMVKAVKAKEKHKKSKK